MFTWCYEPTLLKRHLHMVLPQTSPNQSRPVSLVSLAKTGCRQGIGLDLKKDTEGCKWSSLGSAN